MRVHWVVMVLLLPAFLFGLGRGRVSAGEARSETGQSGAEPGQGCICRIAQRTADLVTLDCVPGYATPHDRITVSGFPQGDQSGVGDTIETLPDITDGSVVFDAEADGSANLVILFSRRPDGALVASIYDDRDGDGKVLVQSRTGEPFVVREAGPVVQVVAPDGWWRRGDTVNFNLDIAVDGVIRASFDARLWSFFRTDGTPEVRIHVRDSDHDGRPELEWRQIDLPVPEQYGYYRTQVVSNVEDDEAPISDSLLWPFLARAPASTEGFAKPSYFDSPPPISVNWGMSQLTRVAEFVASRSGNSNFFIYSLARLREGEISTANLVNPFAFYDLSAGRDKLPTLLIRNSYFRPRDRYLHEVLGESLAPSAIDDVYYAWRHPPELAQEPAAPIWDYQINLVGTHEYTSVVQIGDLDVVTVPYATYPYWVTEQKWDLAAFVANETAKGYNSEGIGAWGALLEHLNPESYRYLAGQIDELPLDRLATIPAGYRGEVAPAFNAVPRVYLSSVDRRLHLVGATSGVWNIDDSAQVRYRNLDNDPYTDQWQYLEGGSVRKQLNVTGSYAIYASGNHVSLKRVGIAPSLFESPPPRDHQEWSELGLQLERAGSTLRPDALDEMFAALQGPTTTIVGAQIRDMRAVDAGVHFVLELQPGFRVDGWDQLDVGRLTAGSYAVTLDQGFRAEPLAPARLELDVSQATPDDAQLYAAGLLRATLVNAGLEDIESVTLVALADKGSASVELGRFKLDVPSGQFVRRQFSWPISPAAPRAVRLRVEDATGKILAESTLSVGATATTPSDTKRAIESLIGRGWPAGAVLVLLALAGCAARLVYNLRNSASVEVDR